jgi:uncharacterized protein (UPF0261 family)
MQKSILVVGTFDSKGTEFQFLIEQLRSHSVSLLTMNVGVMGTTDLFVVDVNAQQVACEAETSLDQLRSANDRGAAIKAMADGASRIARQLFDEGKLCGIIGMGGGGGTSLVTAAMRALPIGIPKVCVSTMAGGDTSNYVQTADITMIPAITDISGLNRISRMVIAQAAAAVVAMTRVAQPVAADLRPLVVASMFGNTTACVDACRAQLTAAGYEVLVFHATGTGGRMMESLIDAKLVDACLDITTTEWADEICGGILSAGPDRLSAPGRNAIPHLIVPGCIDMVNFGAPDSVPQEYRDAGRLLYEWNPAVTLMRTNVAENQQLGRIFAEKANAAKGPVAILLPLKGVSILDGDEERFCDRAADQAMFDKLRDLLREDIPVIEVDCNINDPQFADAAVGLLLELMAARKSVDET